MTKKSEDNLYKKYPKMLAGFKMGPQESCLAFGCEHDDGWYIIIDTLLWSIGNRIKTKNLSINIQQIKEKFGGLRFYYSGGDDVIDGMVTLAENMSYVTCEKCGSTNNVTQTKGWIVSLCPKCMKEK